MNYFTATALMGWCFALRVRMTAPAPLPNPYRRFCAIGVR